MHFKLTEHQHYGTAMYGRQCFNTKKNRCTA